jgi:hypothetical protein
MNNIFKLLIQEANLGNEEFLPTTEGRLKAVEQQLRLSLPHQLRDFYAITDGGFGIYSCENLRVLNTQLLVGRGLFLDLNSGQITNDRKLWPNLHRYLTDCRIGNLYSLRYSGRLRHCGFDSKSKSGQMRTWVGETTLRRPLANEDFFGGESTAQTEDTVELCHCGGSLNFVCQLHHHTERCDLGGPDRILRVHQCNTCYILKSVCSNNLGFVPSSAVSPTRSPYVVIEWNETDDISEAAAEGLLIDIESIKIGDLGLDFYVIDAGSAEIPEYEIQPKLGGALISSGNTDDTRNHPWKLLFQFTDGFAGNPDPSEASTIVNLANGRAWLYQNLNTNEYSISWSI